METTRQDKYVEVGIEQERYALGITDIHEIIRMQHITEIPMSRSYVKGVINLRGKIVPIISLRNRFGLPEEASTRSTRIVVVHQADEMVGIVVDRVIQVMTFADVQPLPEQAGSEQGSFFAGVGRTENGLVSVLKLDRLIYES